MVKLRSFSWLIVGLFLFSIVFQSNYDGQIQTNFQNSPDSFQLKPISLGGDLDEGRPSHAIKNSSLNSLGEIEITHFYFADDVEFPSDDHFFPSSSNIINFTHHIPEFLGTIENASAERAIQRQDPRSTNIKIQISESVIWNYNESVKNYIVGFTPVLQKAFLEKMYFNGTELDPSEYIENSTIDGDNKIYSFYYDFEEVFDSSNSTGEFNLTYVYNMIFPIKEWSVTNIEPNQFISENNQTFTQQFTYNVTLGDESSRIDSLARLRIYLPNHQDIFESNLDIYNNNITLPSNQYAITDNILTFTNATYLNETFSLDMTFKTNFTVELLEIVDGLWCEDRLIEGLNIRERDYKITITEGPADLILENIGINDTELYFDQLYNGGESGRGALDRYVYIENMNKSTGEEFFDPNDTTTLPEYVDGISFLHSVNISIIEPYWLAKNEIDIITIKYFAVHNLSIIIMDRISTPLEGYSVKLFIGNSSYGTSINNFINMPFPMISSDGNGEVVFRSVPIANYTIKIYNKNDDYLENATVTPLEEKNYIVTSIPHYPVTILVFTAISAALISIGFIIFKKNS